jgi:acyl carrier protein
MSPTLAEVLKCWHQQTAYAQQGNWIFASSKLKGRQPRTASLLAADHLRPADIAAGVVLKPGQRFGFHNLRHSLATFLINRENDTKTVRRLEVRRSLRRAIDKAVRTGKQEVTDHFLLDSLDLVEAVMLIEEVFGTEIPDGDALRQSARDGGLA